MTEDEAKTKWCPFARGSLCREESLGDTTVGVVIGGTGYNRGLVVSDDGKTLGLTTPASCFCIASACMAWRWIPGGDTRRKIDAIKEHREQHNSSLLDAKNAVEATWRPAGDTGYCGLAGAPR